MAGDVHINKLEVTGNPRDPHALKIGRIVHFCNLNGVTR